MLVYVPYDPTEPKTRLSPVLSPHERAELSRAMLADVRDRLRRAGQEPVVLTTRNLDVGAPTRVSTAPLSEAVNDALDAYVPSPDDPVGVVMADLGLLTREALSRLAAPDTPVVVAPGRRGGTNALVVRTPEFQVDYHGASYLDHREIAANRELDLATVDSFRLATDIDEPDDLVELLLHGSGRATEYLDARFTLEDGGTELTRPSGAAPADADSEMSIPDSA